MRPVVGTLIPILFAVGFYFGVQLWPSLTSKEMLSGIAALLGFTWGCLGMALPKLSDLSALEGLVSRQREMLIANIEIARKKIWRLGVASFFCIVTLFFLSFVTAPDNAHVIAGFAGIATGFDVFLILAYRRWHDEIHAFITTVNQHNQDAKARKNAMDRLAKHS